MRQVHASTTFSKYRCDVIAFFPPSIITHPALYAVLYKSDLDACLSWAPNMSIVQFLCSCQLESFVLCKQYTFRLYCTSGVCIQTLVLVGDPWSPFTRSLQQTLVFLSFCMDFSHLPLVGKMALNVSLMPGPITSLWCHSFSLQLNTGQSLCLEPG